MTIAVTLDVKQQNIQTSKNGDSIVLYSLLVVACIRRVFCVGSLFCGVVLGDLTSLAIILLKKRGLAPRL